MSAHAYLRGHEITSEGSCTDRKDWRWADTGESVGLGMRACTRCGAMPQEEGYDACLGRLPGVKAACCGHGVPGGTPYVLFDDGTGLAGDAAVEWQTRVSLPITDDEKRTILNDALAWRWFNLGRQDERERLECEHHEEMLLVAHDMAELVRGQTDVEALVEAAKALLPGNCPRACAICSQRKRGCVYLPLRHVIARIEARLAGG